MKIQQIKAACSTCQGNANMCLIRKENTLTSLLSEKLHYKFIESTEDGDFMLALDAVRLLRTTSSQT